MSKQKEASGKRKHLLHPPYINQNTKEWHFHVAIQSIGFVSARSFDGNIHLAIAAVLLLAAGVYALRKQIKNNKLQHQNEQEAEHSRRLEVKNKLLKSDNALLNQEAQNINFLQTVYENTICQWDKIEKKIQAMMDEYRATQKTAIFQEIKQLIADLHEKSNQQLINQAKDFYQKIKRRKRHTATYSQRTYIFVSLLFQIRCQNNCIDTQRISVKKKHEIRKMGIRNKLGGAGAYDHEIEDILFRDYPSGLILQ